MANNMVPRRIKRLREEDREAATLRMNWRIAAAIVTERGTMNALGLALGIRGGSLSMSLLNNQVRERHVDLLFEVLKREGVAGLFDRADFLSPP